MAFSNRVKVARIRGHLSFVWVVSLKWEVTKSTQQVPHKSPKVLIEVLTRIYFCLKEAERTYPALLITTYFKLNWINLVPLDPHSVLEGQLTWTELPTPRSSAGDDSAGYSSLRAWGLSLCATCCKRFHSFCSNPCYSSLSLCAGVAASEEVFEFVAEATAEGQLYNWRSSTVQQQLHNRWVWCLKLNNIWIRKWWAFN